MNRHPCLGMAAIAVLVLTLPQAPATVAFGPDAVTVSARPGAALRPPPRTSDLYICLPANPGGVAECWRP
ncbi:MAG: hypothetical protein JJT81_02725 [Rubellimicrobium sp.]|nr:hypothetical protein [Rubellimicrobium sp.]